MPEIDVISSFPPDDENEKKIQRRGLKPLNRHQIDFVVNNVKHKAPEFLNSVKSKLLIPDEEKSDEYLGNEVIYFNKYCDSIGVDRRLYNTSQAFSEIINFCQLELKNKG